MTKQNKAMISALMDSEESSLKAISALTEDEQNRESWKHYHLIKAILQADCKVAQAVDISAVVAREIEAIPIQQTSSFLGRLAANELWKPVANVAIAASVALFTVTGVLYYQGQQTTTVQSPEMPSNRYQPSLQTVPMGVVGNPLSYSADGPQSFTEPSNTIRANESQGIESSYRMQSQGESKTNSVVNEREKALLQQQIQVFMMDHQIQVQRSLEKVESTENETDNKESNEDFN